MKGHKVRIYPTASQEAYLIRIIGHCRFVYNTLLAESTEQYEKWKEDPSLPKPNVSQIGLVNEIIRLKKEYPWLYEVPAQALQQRAMDLGQAYSHFFTRVKKGESQVGYPKMRKRFISDTFRLPNQSYSIRDNKLWISRFDTDIKVRWDKRGIPHKPTSITVSRDRSGRWHASFLTEYHDDRICGNGQVGIDLGISTLATLSTGEAVANPRHYNNHLRTLQRRHRQHARTQKGSNNREKKRLRLAKAYAKISDTRQDFLHKLSTRLINENQVICLETLNIVGMVKNRRLARSIIDTGWGMFTDMLMYKAKESGANVIFIDRFYPSTQTCSHCSHRLEGKHKLSLKERHWTCPTCDTTHDRDINAAVNILRQGTLQVRLPKGTSVLISVDE